MNHTTPLLPCPSCDCDRDADEIDFIPRKLRPAGQSFLEPRGEGILFAVLCLLASTIIYAGVILVRALA